MENSFEPKFTQISTFDTKSLSYVGNLVFSSNTYSKHRDGTIHNPRHGR